MMSLSKITTRSKVGFIDPGPILDEVLSDGDIEMTMDEEPQDDARGEEKESIEADEALTADKDRLIIAVDFGTTFSSVAYVHLLGQAPADSISLRDVHCIGNFPGYRRPTDLQSDRFDVPTELWYDPGGRRAFHGLTPIPAVATHESDDSGGDSNGSDDDLSNDDDSEYEEDNVHETIELGEWSNRGERSGTQHWGFTVQHQLGLRDIPKKDAKPLARFKLMLDEKKETAEVRTALKPILRSLKSKKVIKEETDIFRHYLSHLLIHTKKELQSAGVLRNCSAVEFVLCVPAKWPSKGCRIMQAAMDAAVKEAAIGEEANRSISNLFMISEPEAAAASLLSGHDNEIYYGETVVILDAGGGTVDAVTYKCTHDDPVRLSAEVVAPNSKLCGASYINKRFEKVLSTKLATETYLVKNGKTIESIAESKTSEFENNSKRKIDTTKRNATIAPVYVDDLREDLAKNFYQNRIAITPVEIYNIFHPSLRGARSVLNEQLELAKSAGQKVEKVILTGGFGQSKALQSYLAKYLRTHLNSAGTKIELVIPDNPSTAVARGAVLRALNKDHGPSRITQCSYGYLTSEPYEPEVIEAHRQTKCRINKADGEKYVDGTINWILQVGESVPNGFQKGVTVRHTFSLTTKRFLCQEELYVSDEVHQSHYRKAHPVNKGAELAGSIVVDMTFLRTRGLIHPESPSAFSTYSNTDRRHWAVEFDLVMIVEGRSLRFEARWPLVKDLREGQRQEVHAQGQVCIAAAFQPGTA